MAICIGMCGCNSGGSIVPTSQENTISRTVARKTMHLGQSYLNKAYGIASDSSGHVYLAMADQNIIQKISVSDGSILTVAGNGFVGKPVTGKPATTESLNLVAKRNNSQLSSQKSFYGSIAIDKNDNIYIADIGNNEIEKVDHKTGIMTVVAGGGNSNPANGIPATSVELSSPTGVAVDANDNLYIADNGNGLLEQITKGKLNIIAGGGNNTPSAKSESATSVSIMPYGVATDSDGNVYITDQTNNFVEKIDISTNMLSVIAGNGNNGVPVTGVATDSPLGSNIDGLSVDGKDNVYIADASNNEIEKIESGQLSVIVGNGQNGYPYLGIPTKSSLSKPHGVGVDKSGNVYIADTNNQIIEKYSTTTNKFYINYGTGFIRLVGAFQCVNDAVTGNKCGCLYDPQSGYVWYAGIKTGYLTNWQINGNAINTFNSKGHCGINNWHLPKIVTPSWSGNPYDTMPLVDIYPQAPGGSLSALALASVTINGTESFHLLKNGFYKDSTDDAPSDQLGGYWLNNPNGTYKYMGDIWGYALGIGYGNMGAVASKFTFNGGTQEAGGRILLVSN